MQVHPKKKLPQTGSGAWTALERSARAKKKLKVRVKSQRVARFALK